MSLYFAKPNKADSGVIVGMSQKQILIVAGEASADRYGARLVSRLNAVHGPDALCFYGTGGDEMQKAGVHLQCHIRELAHIGVRELSACKLITKLSSAW